MAEKTEQPTPKKQKDSREEGQIAYSQDVPQIVTCVAATLFFWNANAYFFNKLKEIILAPSNIVIKSAFTQQLMLLTKTLATLTFEALVPLLMSIFFIAIAGELMQVGIIFTPKKIIPNFSKFNVISTIKQRFAISALIDILKMIFKTVFLIIVAGTLVIANFKDLMLLSVATPVAALGITGKLMGWIILASLIFLIPIMLFDLFWQRLQTTKKIKMSKDEIKKEFKEIEGQPELKTERRRRHQELSNEEIQKRVARSSAVVVNPIHLAVGFYYKAGETPLPMVTIKDYGSAVKIIRKAAEDNGIPIIENVKLARAMFRTAEMDRYIPSELIESVAAIIAALEFVIKTGHKINEKNISPI